MFSAFKKHFCRFFAQFGTNSADHQQLNFRDEVDFREEVDFRDEVDSQQQLNFRDEVDFS